MFKWCIMAIGGYNIGAIGGKNGVVEHAIDSGSKGKSVKEVTDLEAEDDDFMEIEE